MGSALGSDVSILEVAGTGYVQHGGTSWSLLTEAVLAALQLPKSCHINQMQCKYFNISFTHLEVHSFFSILFAFTIKMTELMFFFIFLV